MSRSSKILSFQFIAGDEGFECLTLDESTLVLNRQIQYAQRILAGLNKRYIVYGDGDRRLSQGIQLMCLDLGIFQVMQSVIDLERTALEIHLIVQGRGRIVVVIVVLMGGDDELIIFGFEYRCAE